MDSNLITHLLDAHHPHGYAFDVAIGISSLRPEKKGIVAGTPLQIEREATPEPKLSVVDVLVDSLKRWVFSVQDYSLLSARSVKKSRHRARAIFKTLSTKWTTSA